MAAAAAHSVVSMARAASVYQWSKDERQMVEGAWRLLIGRSDQNKESERVFPPEFIVLGTSRIDTCNGRAHGWLFSIWRAPLILDL
jgi:hypothetical protein